jgi:hypothetical protein
MAKLSVKEFFAKLDWEGGYTDLAYYGLDAKEVTNKQLAALWQEYRDKYAELEALTSKLDKMRPKE